LRHPDHANSPAGTASGRSPPGAGAAGAAAPAGRPIRHHIADVHVGEVAAASDSRAQQWGDRRRQDRTRRTVAGEHRQTLKQPSGRLGHPHR
jgi:hypothetical protein